MAKQLFDCKLGRSLAAPRPITGRLPTGSLSITATSISADAAQYSSMSPARLLRNWCLRWEKMAMPICSGVITSGVSPRRWRLRMLPISWQAKRLPLTAPVKEHICFSQREQLGYRL